MLPNTEQLKPIWQQSFATLALTLLILFFLYKWLHPNSSPNKTLTPSPPWLPILGNLHQLGTHPHRALKSLSEKYGDLMLIHLGRSPAIVVSSDKLYVSEDELEQMKYLKAVIKETLRLHPPIPLLVPRQSTHDTMINGYDIPSGTMVINNAWAIHRDPASWDEPEKFNPERFLNRPTHFRGQDFELIPFGAGRMICPGITFATANNELVLANLVHKFGWKLPGGADGGETLDMGERIGITAHRNIPLLAVATPVIADN